MKFKSDICHIIVPYIYIDFIMFFLLILGCKPPPQAPADYEQLLDYIFAHSGDEDDAASGWLDQPPNVDRRI